MGTSDGTKSVALGLQGGGSHTAFTWGVLDRLLEEVQNGALHITAISGTSGGALNGVVCAYGMLQGAAEAKRLLEKFWIAVSDESRWPENPLNTLLWPRENPARWNVDWNPLAISLGMAEQIWSPYLNPWDWHNIIGRVLASVITDFGALGANGGRALKLFVCATAVDRTALRIFGPGEITLDAVIASACLPTLFRAMKIGEASYWDGGYMANPALAPLVRCADDLLTVLVDPLVVKGGPPINPRQIVNRINEVSFSSSWVLEMRQIEFINELLRKGHLKGTHYKQKRFHLIHNDNFMEAIGAASKIVPSRDFLFELRDRGRQAAASWIKENFSKLGCESSLDVRKEVELRLDGSQGAVAALKP